jgi:hypothetical protein
VARTGVVEIGHIAAACFPFSSISRRPGSPLPSSFFGRETEETFFISQTQDFYPFYPQ